MYTIYNNSKKHSGNNTTLTRISKLLNLNQSNEVKDNIIGIHAYKFGKEVVDKNLNYVLILGGTDVNRDIEDEEKKEIIIKSVEQAKYVVAFNDLMKNKIIQKTSINENKIRVIPQSIKKIKTSDFNLREKISQKYNLENVNKIFIMVGNLRDEKDPFYLKDAFKKLYVKEKYILVIIGDIIDDNNYKFGNGIYHLDGMKKKDIFACMKQADGLVNSSKSEGMAISILEAMIYKCPVYVRNNEDNNQIVKDNYTGFIYNNSKDFVKTINKDTQSVINNAFNYVKTKHNSITEKYSYKSLLD